MSLFSIGYEKRSLAAFCDALLQGGVEVLIDVRERAWSQRPEFRKTALAGALRERGIDYVHCKRAGNPFRPRAGEVPDFDACIAAYTRHLDAHPEVLDEVQSLASNRRAALFCYEGHRTRCHRGLLFEALTRRIPGVSVVDL
jgi:uncharacterized protein (DUF488 family)